MTERMFGQCECGGPLTVMHLQHHCPLRSGPAMSDEARELLEDIVTAAMPNPQRGEGFAFFAWTKWLPYRHVSRSPYEV